MARGDITGKRREKNSGVKGIARVMEACVETGKEKLETERKAIEMLGPESQGVSRKQKKYLSSWVLPRGSPHKIRTKKSFFDLAIK